ncbi:MAG TPA: D-alanyl-D-alanine carboxypeptidase/D-alanyl-D-alanine-endopeptidase [Succinivibrio sp.]|nr:D-alanyl-D-alanine carboxypeptidase/D-alanyl-D-alanine-endopeptidase [Succinivibrio sp.]
MESKSLSELTKYMLHKSNNLYADAIAKTVAAEFYKLPATYHRTVNALRQVLNRYANINLGNTYLVDGNGLSPHNLVTPHKMLEILEFINKNDQKLDFIKLLPVADESGTLHWRASTRNPPLAKNVTAKTGTIQNVSNLMGFMHTKSGVRVPFVFYTNSISYDQKTRDLVKYHKIASPHLRYERYVLEQIYDEKVMGVDF